MGKGGGSAGEINYPVYMQTAHNDWLDGTGVDTMTTSIVDLMNAAQLGASPYTGFATVDPAVVFGVGVQVLTAFQALEDLDALNLQTIFDTFFAALDNNAQITAIVAAESADLSNILTTEQLPRFQAGMRTIGAVLTSAFTLGQANIEAQVTRALAKLDAGLRLQSRERGWQLAIQWVQLTVDWNRNIAMLITDITVRYSEVRIKVDQLDVEMDTKDVLFDMEVYQYGGNVLASISGAASVSKSESSGISGALGGALSGAATGAQIASMFPDPTGTTMAIGVAAGGIAGLFGGM